MSFQDNLRRYREAQGLSAKDLAKLVGISHNTYSHYENAQVEPRFSTLIKIATALHVSIDELMGYKSDNIAPNVDLCQKMGLWVKVDKDGIHILDGNQQPIATLSATMFNLLVPHLLEESAISANRYFTVLLGLYYTNIKIFREGLAKKNIQIDDKNLFEFLKATLGNKFMKGFLLDENSKDSEFTKMVQKAIEQEEAESKK